MRYYIVIIGTLVCAVTVGYLLSQNSTTDTTIVQDYAQHY